MLDGIALSDNATVLDSPCGFGRNAIALAAKSPVVANGRRSTDEKQVIMRPTRVDSAFRIVRRAFLGRCRSRGSRRGSWTRRRWRSWTRDLGRRTRRRRRRPSRRWWRRSRHLWCWPRRRLDPAHFRLRRDRRDWLGRRYGGFVRRRWRHILLPKRFRSERLCFGMLNQTARLRLSDVRCRR